MTGASKEDYDRRQAALAENLATIGFGPAFGFGGLFGPSAANCLSCGAMVQIAPEDGADNSVRVHHDWHARTEAAQ